MMERIAQIALINPKYPRNLGGIIRIASCYGIEKLYWSGKRMVNQIENMSRIPREERMRGYASVVWEHDDRFIDRAVQDNITPVSVEFSPSQAEELPGFIHPERALYVFGPEDGSIPRGYNTACHRFVYIPTKHCLNLATAVATVMYDRMLKI